MKRWDGTTQISLTTAKRWDGSAFVALTTAKRWTGSAFVDIPLPGGGGGPLAVVLSASFAINYRQVPSGPSVVTLTTSAVTATPSGGTGSYTYSWAQVAGLSGITATAPTAASTAFSATLTKNSEKSGLWRCTVSDGVHTATADVSVDFAYYVGAIP